MEWLPECRFEDPRRIGYYMVVWDAEFGRDAYDAGVRLVGKQFLRVDPLAIDARCRLRGIDAVSFEKDGDVGVAHSALKLTTDAVDKFEAVEYLHGWIVMPNAKLS